jgi:hypothetical protein
MKRITYWWPLAKSLAAFLNEQQNEAGKKIFEGVAIYTGTKGTAKSYPCIEVTYDGEQAISFTQFQGNVDLWADLWLKSSSNDPAEAYDLQDAMQQKVLAVLIEWPAQILEKLGIATKLTIKEITSDGDLYRPSVGARIVLNIEWRKSI